MMTAERVRVLIAEGLPGAEVHVQGDDGRHFEALVVSESFAGLGAVRRHQLVYRALGSAMQSDIHALSLTTLTPAEWQTRSGGAG